MQYHPGTPLDRFFTEENKEALLCELRQSEDGPLFAHFIRLCKANLPFHEHSDEFNDRLADFMCDLIDLDKPGPLCTLLQIDPFMGIYSKEEFELCPLSYAIFKHNVSLSKAMIDILSPSNLTTTESYDPGMVAIMENQKEIVRYLVEKDCPYDYFAGAFTALQMAVKEMKTDIVKMLVEEFHQNVNYMVVHQFPPLTIAVDNDDLELVSFLLQQDAIMVNQIDIDGKQPLDYAKSEEVRALLINSGAKKADDYAKHLSLAYKRIPGDSTEALRQTQALAKIPSASAVNGYLDLLKKAIEYNEVEIVETIVDHNLVDLSTYRRDLLWAMCFGTCHGLDNRSTTDIVALLSLLVEHGYKYPLKADHPYAEAVRMQIVDYGESLLDNEDKLMFALVLVLLRRVGFQM